MIHVLIDVVFYSTPNDYLFRYFFGDLLKNFNIVQIDLKSK